jgi:hypothetical protein
MLGDSSMPMEEYAYATIVDPYLAFSGLVAGGLIVAPFRVVEPT